jgi:solute carrier family 24 (sodium/potassium/calcium exchanger), member 3
VLLCETFQSTGHGSMGISNSIGSNTFDILLCLGLPWLFKAAFLPTEPNHHWVRPSSSKLHYNMYGGDVERISSAFCSCCENVRSAKSAVLSNLYCSQVAINSAGLEYSAISLLSTLFMMYATFYFNKFRLDKRVGRVCLCMYAVFLLCSTLIELNVLFQVNLPTCE